MVSFAVFNELSLPYKNNNDVEIGFVNFFKLLRDLKKNNINSLKTDVPAKDWEIVEGVYFQLFLNNLKDPDLKTRIKIFINNELVKIESPLIRESEEDDGLIGPNYLYNGEHHFGGLACANYWNALAISFNSLREWAGCKVTILKDEKETEVLHASEVSHLNEHQCYFDQLENNLRLSINQRNFWQVKENYFSSFRFLEKVEKEINELDFQVFSQLVSTLRSIETGEKKLSDLDIAPESPSVTNSTKLRAFRVFGYKGQQVYFERHIRNFPKGYRVHFIEENSKIVIGYVGVHLPTKKYK